MSFPERRLRTLLIAHAIWSAILACGYLVGGDTATLGFMPNSFAKDVLFVTLSAIGAADVRRYGWTAVLVAIGYVALVVGQIVTIAWGGAPDQDVLGLVSVSGAIALLAWMAVDIVLAALFFAWWMAAVRAQHRLRYLHPIAFLSLVALADVLIEGTGEVVPPADVAHKVDDYLAELNARGKSRVQLALIVLGLWPLLTLRPPLPMLAPATRKRFLEKRFLEEVAEGRTFRPLRPIIQTLIRTGAQMSYLGYYGDRRAWKDIGYVPFRDRQGGRQVQPTDAPGGPLRSLGLPPRDTHYDTVVVGSGAAGAILAYRFAEAGRRVLVLERGPHADPRQFTDDEVEQYLRLYNEGALELATNFGLQVLQGMCVGGGTTINNALCLDPPTPVIDSWTRYGLDRSALEGAIREVRAWLSVEQIEERTTTVAARRFATAVRELGLPGELTRMDANITSACVGCGYCNIGCAYGAKTAGLDFVLPVAQQRYGIDVLADFEVERIVRAGDGVSGVTGVHAGGDRVSISAGEVIIAAGPIGSSYLLQRSGIGGDAVGDGLHFNINSPLTCEFPDPVDSFAGIQMSHAYAAPGEPPAYLVETWFNPPATQALAMPGWFDEHFRNMRRYRYMASAGVLVGTTTPGRVRATADGPAIEYTASDTDRRRLVEGLKVAGRIWMQAGAKRVMPATFASQEYRTPEALRGFDPKPGDLLMTSAHPQGGNALGTVVDEDFRVRGYRNLFLCDASVFPSSVHVNPQLTVMGMAQYAARRILQLPPPVTVTQRPLPPHVSSRVHSH